MEDINRKADIEINFIANKKEDLDIEAKEISASHLNIMKMGIEDLRNIE